MCLGVPGQVAELRDGHAVVDYWGVRRAVRLDLIEGSVAVGDYVLTHVGFAIRRIPTEEVERTMALFAELAASSSDTDPMAAEVRGELGPVTMEGAGVSDDDADLGGAGSGEPCT